MGGGLRGRGLGGEREEEEEVESLPRVRRRRPAWRRGEDEGGWGGVGGEGVEGGIEEGEEGEVEVGGE